MTRIRKQIFAVLFPIYDKSARQFRRTRSGPNFATLQSTMLAMQCADAQPESVLVDILATVEPGEYVRVLCTHKEKR